MGKLKNKNEMELEIYKIIKKDCSSFKQEEVCRACAKKEIEKGYEVEFDKHLSKYIHNEDGVSYYSDGDTDEEISCSECGESFKGLKNEPLLDDEFSTCG